MGDDAGLGLLTSVLSGIIGTAAKVGPVVRQGIRMADPKRLKPVIEAAQKSTLLRPIPYLEKNPLISKVPEWARGFMGIATSPAGIIGEIGLGGMLAGSAAQPTGNRARPTPSAKPALPVATNPDRTVAPPPQALPRVDASTTQILDQGAATAPAQSPVVIPATLTTPPTPVPTMFPLTPEGQFERYFQTPEFDYVFGESSRGSGAPTTAEAMLALARELRAEKEAAPLSTYYRAQSAAGRSQMGDIKKALGYEEGSDLAEWAEANPMLAQRLYAKKAKATQD